MIQILSQLTLKQGFNHTVTAGTISLPLWLYYLGQISDVAALLAPIVGVSWVGLQIYFAIKDRKK